MQKDKEKRIWVLSIQIEDKSKVLCRLVLVIWIPKGSEFHCKLVMVVFFLLWWEKSVCVCIYVYVFPLLLVVFGIMAYLAYEKCIPPLWKKWGAFTNSINSFIWQIGFALLIGILTSQLLHLIDDSKVMLESDRDCKHSFCLCWIVSYVTRQLWLEIFLRNLYHVLIPMYPLVSDHL